MNDKAFHRFQVNFIGFFFFLYLIIKMLNWQTDLFEFYVNITYVILIFKRHSHSNITK